VFRAPLSGAYHRTSAALPVAEIEPTPPVAPMISMDLYSWLNSARRQTVKQHPGGDG
jgi:hypothetical protein